jgi:nitrilase
MTAIRVAAVQAAPVFLDRDSTVEKAIGLIERAAEDGASVIGFPEGFVPGHPGWVELLPLDERALALSRRLFKNAIEVPGREVDSLAAACRRGGIAAVVGACERLPRTTGTLFNTQILIDGAGDVAKHQKLVPTAGERLVHAPGGTGSFNAVTAGDLTVTGLICGENSNPLAQYATARAYPTVHVAAWPQHFSPWLEMQPIIELVSRALAYSLKCFVLNSVSTIGPEMLDAYGDDSTLEFLTSDVARGRACVVAPSGEIISSAQGPEEQIVFADIETEDVIVPKFVHDTAGHYNRPELFAHLFGAHAVDAAATPQQAVAHALAPADGPRADS